VADATPLAVSLTSMEYEALNAKLIPRKETGGGNGT